MAARYGIADLTRALREVGLREGDVVFGHSNVAWFGQPDWATSAAELCRGVWDAFCEVIGPRGTLVVPTFTYSFCRNAPFDVAATASDCGLFAEWVRKRPDARRSEDPIFSVAAVGPAAEALTARVPLECFGAGSFWERLIDHDGIVCNLNVFELGSTMFHYIERRLNVPYRYDKRFPGILRRGESAIPATALYFCNDLSNPSIEASNDAFSALALAEGIGAKATVGRGYVGGVRARRMLALIERTLPSRPWLLTRADRAPTEPTLVRAPETAPPALAPDATPLEIVAALDPLERDLVSDGIDAALAALGRVLPLTVRRFITGTHVADWIVPERWTCGIARLARIDGRVVFEGRDRVAAYSLARRESKVARAELLARLYVADAPDAIPRVSLHDGRDWGLCASARERDALDALDDPQYVVTIESAFSRGELAIGECAIPGTSGRWIALLTTLAGGANCGLSGVAVGVDVMRRLAAAPRPRIGIRLIVLPGAAALPAVTDVASLADTEFTIHLDGLGTSAPPGLAGTRADVPEALDPAVLAVSVERVLARVAAAETALRR